jgi:hypothetical protein
MTTTFEKFAGQSAANYCTHPTINVEILPEARHCEKCGEQVRYVPAKGYGLGNWEHVVPQNDPATKHYITPRTVCTYCHSDAPDLVRFHQEAWADVVRCTRCGGANGHGIGD